MVFWQVWPMIEQGMSTWVGSYLVHVYTLGEGSHEERSVEWTRDVVRVSSRRWGFGWWSGAELWIMKKWAQGRTESGEGSQAACLVSWQAWLMFLLLFFVHQYYIQYFNNLIYLKFNIWSNHQNYWMKFVLGVCIVICSGAGWCLVQVRSGTSFIYKIQFLIVAIFKFSWINS